MQSRRKMGWWLGALLLAPGFAQAQQAMQTTVPPLASKAGPSGSSSKTMMGIAIPIEQLPSEVQAKVKALVDRPTMRTQGSVEIFNCQPEQYFWLLDHPELTAKLWRALGAKVTEIKNHGGGHFSWQDDNGSKVEWDTVLRTSEYRIWYAEGKVKPGLLLPMVSVRAVLAVRHAEGQDGDGKPAVRHQIDLILQTDNAAVALAARLLGASAPHLSEQYVGQIEMFFGAMAWYLDQHPRHAAVLLADLQRPATGLTRPAGRDTPPPPARFPAGASGTRE
jgi:hypothetical protein